MSVRFLQRSDTAANWVSANPVLGDGEIGYVSDEHYHKVGDGVTPWNDLPEQFPDHIREGDSRLSDAREPTSHTHTLADITDAGTAAGAATTDFDAAGTASSTITTHKSEASAHTAATVDYDNATSGVAATTVQAAIDDVYGQLGDISTVLDTINGESV